MDECLIAKLSYLTNSNMGLGGGVLKLYQQHEHKGFSIILKLLNNHTITYIIEKLRRLPPREVVFVAQCTNFQTSALDPDANVTFRYLRITPWFAALVEELSDGPKGDKKQTVRVNCALLL